MGFHDGGDSGEGGRTGVKGGRARKSAETRDTTRRERERGMNEGRTAMLRIGTKG